MGHYDSYYEAEYKREREESGQLRNAQIPQILEALENAKRLLSIYKGNIDKSNKMVDDIEYMKLALKGQLNG